MNNEILAEPPLSYVCSACTRRIAPPRPGRCPICKTFAVFSASAEEPHKPPKFRRPGAPVVPSFRPFRPFDGVFGGPPGPRFPAFGFPAYERGPDPEEEPVEAPEGALEARISRTFAFDARRACNEKFAVLARTGGGKTYTGCVLLEEMYANELQFVAIDPLGGMGGLQWNEDGSPGLEDVIFLGGDENEDNETAQKLSPMQGGQLATEICEEGRSYVLDLSHMRKDAQVVFVADLIEQLYFLQRKRKKPLHMMVDEADLFAPQAGASDDQKRSMGALEDVWRRGRARGFGGTLISQRPSVLHKNLLTQTGCLLVGQLTSPQDREAVGEWVRANADEGVWSRLRDSLPTLEKGTFYAWSPGWLCDSPRRIKVRKRFTQDSSATPGMVDADIEQGSLSSEPGAISGAHAPVLGGSVDDEEES